MTILAKTVPLSEKLPSPRNGLYLLVLSQCLFDKGRFLSLTFANQSEVLLLHGSAKPFLHPGCSPSPPLLSLQHQPSNLIFGLFPKYLLCFFPLITKVIQICCRKFGKYRKTQFKKAFIHNLSTLRRPMSKLMYIFLVTVYTSAYMDVHTHTLTYTCLFTESRQ